MRTFKKTDIVSGYSKYICLVVLALLMFSCSSGKSGANEENNIVDEISDFDNGADGCTYWTVNEYYDKFGDKTGQKCIIFECEGKFSNSVVEDEPLRVQIIVDDEEVFFKLYPYKNQLLKGRGLLFADVKLDNGKIISLVLNNEGLGDTRIVRSSASPKIARDIFLFDGPTKFYLTNDRMRPTHEYSFTYDGMSWDYEQSMDELGILFDD